MSSTVPPTYYFNGIQYNSDFFKSSTDGITLGYAETNYLSRIGAPTSIASNTNFTGDLTISGQATFNNLSTPPHCATLPSNDNDLCNKLYVDSQAALTAYQLFLNYSETFTTPAPASIIYKKLNPLQIASPSTVGWTSNNTTPVLIGGFFNSLVGENIPTSIPAGVWTLLCYSNVSTIADQSHVGILYTLVGYDASGVETILYTSPTSALLTVVSPLIGTSNVSGTVPLTSLVGYTGLGLKLYIQGNAAAVRTGNIYFQNADSYSSILTSFAVTQAPDLLSLPNIWTNTNNFTFPTTTTSISSSGNHTMTGANPTIQSTITSNPLIIRSDATSSTNAIILRSISGDVNITPAGAVSVPSTLTVTGALNGIPIVSSRGIVSNVCIGSAASNASATGTGCVSIGSNAGAGLTTGNNNLCLGGGACQALTIGGQNVGIGGLALTAVISSSKNTAVGFNAGSKITTGASNTNIGNQQSPSTDLNTTGTFNTTLGAEAICASSALNYASAIGAGASVSVSDTIVLGRTSGIVNCPNALNIGGITTTNNINCAGTLTMSNTILANRIINNVFYNLVNFTTGANSVIYADGTNIYYDGRVDSGNHTFINKDSGGTGIQSLVLNSTAITHKLNTTLPTLGIDPTAGQLGYTPAPVYLGPTALLTGTPRTINSLVIGSGTYILNGSHQMTCTTAGTMTNLSFGFSTSTSVYAISSDLGLSSVIDTSNRAFVINATVQSRTTSCIVQFTASSNTIHFITSWIGTGGYNIGGATSITRIA